MILNTMTHRPRRLRQTAKMRALVQENHLQVKKLIYPLFIREDGNDKQAISSMPGQYQWSLQTLPQEIEAIQQLGITAVILFGIPQSKDECGSQSWHQDGIVQRAIRLIKQQAPELMVIADLCFCEYTDHGHCGIINKATQDVDNDATLPLLVKQALSLAQAGADILAPSGMMDNMIAALRQGLDAEGFSQRPLMSYAVKYASHFYGPFREAANGAPQFGDRKTYQMNSANAHEALREANIDVAQGADFLMVKPAGAYLDIIYRVKQVHPEIPLVAYQVSGEYAMLMAASERGWLNEREAVLESLMAIKRAGADIIITYFAKKVAAWLNETKESC